MSLLRFPIASSTGRSLAGLLVAGVASLFLAACGGGGGDPGTPPFGGTDPKAADLSLVLSKSQLKNSGSDSVVATVVAVAPLSSSSSADLPPNSAVRKFGFDEPASLPLPRR